MHPPVVNSVTASAISVIYHPKAEPIGPSPDKQDVVSRVACFLLKALYLLCKAQRHCFKKHMILNKLAQQGDFNVPPPQQAQQPVFVNRALLHQ